MNGRGLKIALAASVALNIFAVAGAGAGAPVLIPAGALGNTRDLLVSQQHRMLVTGWRAELMFGEPEVLVAADRFHVVRPRPGYDDLIGMDSLPDWL